MTSTISAWIDLKIRRQSKFAITKKSTKHRKIISKEMRDKKSCIQKTGNKMARISLPIYITTPNADR